MPLLRALKPWFNKEHEGMIHPGDEFETSEYRARELVNLEMAVYAVSTTEKVKVMADPPERQPDPAPSTPEPEPAPPARPSAPAKPRRKGR
jgi:hypothetical protein